MPDILFETVGPVGLLTINRPEKLNSLTGKSFQLIAEYSLAAQADPEIFALVVTGAGRQSFCVGGDLDELIPRLAAGEGELVVPDPAKRFFSDVFKPVIAAVNGACIGGGLELLLGTDLRIVGAGSVFGLGEVRFGVIPGAGAHVRLPRQIPWAMAMQLLLTGEPIPAKRAYEVGLVNEVVAPEEVLPRAMELATLIAANAPVAVRTAKEIAVRGLALEPAFALERALTERVMRTDDAREGPKAFVEKRKPIYTGH